MKRRTFLPFLGWAPLSLAYATLRTTRLMHPEKLLFKDGGTISNSRYSLRK